MKKTGKFLVFALVAFMMVLGCSKNDTPVDVKDPIQKDDPKEPEEPEEPEEPQGEFNLVDVQVNLPTDSDLDLSGTTIFTLARPSTVETNGSSELPFNPGTGQLAFLMDGEDNLLLAGFLTDDRKEISVATTTEVMLYFSLGYTKTPDNLKQPYVNAVQQIAGYQNLVSDIEALFVADPLMYTKGDYTSAINAKIAEITTIEWIDESARIAVDSKDTRSGITISDVDDSNIQLQNSQPRRAHTFVYKKSFKDEDGNETQIDNYTSNPITDFKVEPGRKNSGDETQSVSIQQQCEVGTNFIENSTTSEPINLPLSEGESSADYEVVVVGPGTGKSGSGNREFTPTERVKFEQLSKESYILDNFLPTLLDIGGNKGMLPPFGDSKEQDMVNAVLPFLEANTEALNLVLENDFDSASKKFIPDLYEDIRQSNDLRELLKNVYDVVDGGEFPNTFVQSQELIETGEARLKSLTHIIDQNINSYDNKCNNYGMEQNASLESWTVTSSDGNVKLSAANGCIQLRGYVDITARVTTELAAGDELEYEWSTTSNFGGNVNDFTNSGTSITSSKETVSFSSTALNSELSAGDNIETVTVKAFVKNANGRTEVGSDEIQVCILKDSFIIKPNGICIEGNSGVVLKLIHNDGETTIPNSETDYKVVWTTSGTYGNFLDGNTIATTYNSDAMPYQSFDTEVKKGIDTFTAVIYGKPKDGTGDYQLVNEAEAAICVNNDPKEIVRLIDSQFILIVGPVVGDGTHNAHYNTFKVFPHEDAIRYKLEVLDYKYQGVSQSSQIRSFSWDANDETYLRTVGDETFYWPLYGLHNSINTVQPSYNAAKAVIQGIKGLALLTITIE